MKRSELIQDVIGWNNRFPLDRWWRIKHNVAFMSPVHRKSSFIHQLMEFEEDKLFMEGLGVEDKYDKYIPGSHDIFKSPNTQEAFLKEAEHEIEELLKLQNKEEEEDG